MRSAHCPSPLSPGLRNSSTSGRRCRCFFSKRRSQAAAGDKQGAIANYKKSSELNSCNTNAAERLKKLESKSIKSRWILDRSLDSGSKGRRGQIAGVDEVWRLLFWIHQEF